MVQTEPFEEGGERFSVTVSIGMAQCPHDGLTSEAIVRAADERLGRARLHGRNCVIAV
jgi:GGDEF domain-containing protein